LIVVMLIFGLLAMLRGFTRDVLAIASWGAAALARSTFIARAALCEALHSKDVIALAFSAAPSSS